jgi:hypothetical protein
MVMGIHSPWLVGSPSTRCPVGHTVVVALSSPLGHIQVRLMLTRSAEPNSFVPSSKAIQALAWRRRLRLWTVEARPWRHDHRRLPVGPEEEG